MVATTNTKALGTGKTTDRDGRTTRKRRSTRSRATNTSHIVRVTNTNQPSRREPRSRSSENNSQLLCTSTRALTKHDLSAVSADAARLMRREDTSCLSFGLRSSYLVHSKIMCPGCLSFETICLSNGWSTEKKKRSKLNRCERSWYPFQKNDKFKEVRAAACS